MTDPLVALRERFASALGKALGPQWAGTDPMLRTAERPRFGDYQANAAMRLGRVLGRPSRKVAAAVAEHLELDGICAPPVVAGPGFINLRLDDGWLAAQAGALLGDVVDELEARGLTTVSDGAVCVFPPGFRVVTATRCH